MVSTDKIQTFFKFPEKIRNEDISDLKEASEFFPYASSLAVLYLNSLKKHNRIEYQDELNRLAIRVNDREILFGAYRTDTVKDENEADAQISIEINNTSKQVEEKILNIQNIELKSEKNEAYEIKHEENSNQIEVDWQKVSNTQIDKQNLSEPNTIDNEIFDHKSELIEFEISDQSNNKNDSFNELEISIESSAISASFFDYQKDKEDSQPVISNEETISLPSEKLNSTDDSLNCEEKKVLPSKEISISSESIFSFNSWLKMGQLEFDGESTSNKMVQIERKSTAFYSPTKNAKKSIDEESIPLSETLGKIFELQGKINKAEEIYTKLGLLNPEKKAYFAGLIKNLKK